jgi:tetratricopeptide (TPR) repeat protein
MNQSLVVRWIRAAVVCALLPATAGALLPRTAGAQDMTFSTEETGEPPAPPAEGPPSEALANALRLYQQERYPEAAVQFQRVVEGETQDAPANVQKAQFFLGKSLYHLRYYQSALSVFDEITQQGEGHLFYSQTLQWLAQLATQLPPPAGMVEMIGRYGMGQLKQFDTDETRSLFNHLLFLMGRSKYTQGEFEQAIKLFKQIDKSSEYYVRAKFFEGITHIRRRRARPAIASFRAIVEGINEDEVEGVDDEDRMWNLAWISLARVYYTAANQTNPKTGERNVDGRLLGQAVEAWNQVEQSSEYWLDAMFESSWAFFLADEYSRALGNVHTLYSPYFQDAYYPEALVLKAVTFFVNCQIKNAAAMVRKFHSKYDPVQEELEQVLSQFEDNTEFFEFLKRVRAGEANLSPRIRGIVTSALSDRTVLRHLEYVSVLKSEEKRLDQAPAEFKNSSLGARIRQDIAVAKSFAVDETGELVRGRYDRLLRELQDLMNQIDTVDLEIATYKRGELSRKAQDQMTAAARSGGGEVEVDEEHQLWPFNGEYWRDELGFYRQQVTNKCGR